MIKLPPREKIYFADLHIHSRYSRATSKEMTIPTLARVAKEKGLEVVATGDFTHPDYLAELEEYLIPAPEDGLYVYKEDPESPRFILSAEVSNIFSQGDKKNRRVHTVILAPSLEIVREINKALAKFGNLSADGRPIFGFPVKDLVKLLRRISPDILIIPAHIWTPWYSLFGAFSGFDSIEECFEEEAEHIDALETGLSSDPAMNWRLSTLDRYALVSNSDAHSPSKLAREANAFFRPLGYQAMAQALRNDKLAFTVEFYPEEGKYHYDGHRNCGVLFSPEETMAHGGKCPVCGEPLTVGVMHRVVELADRPNGFKPEEKPPAVHLVPLQEIVAEALGKGVQSQIVARTYRQLLERAGSELDILLYKDLSELKSLFPERIVEGISRVREGRLYIKPGFDGVYGKIRIFEPDEEEQIAGPRQKSLFA
ncbi:PHP domain protein [Thermodesulfatator indicus DSM 15286]|uniref:PHP domain protein n=1 Tax=Thermodesulfatator indicus (strain DSM 15286 / JCM 11887 / CIR29812) TaxID=667014 RepID=F8A860_THEID|nr:endonuclease Q family protein [Thermodesulfatator indicus]AEH45061.1 PHP domain protein [Thermodesulfatator indicus DSM 15286]